MANDVVQTVGKLEARVDELEKKLAEQKKEKHTCTGDNCHVVDDRIESLQAELDAIKATESTTAAADSSEDAETSCPECGESLNVPAGTKGRVRCGGCKGEFRVKA